MRMRFKVGIVRHTREEGWSREYGIFLLEEDSDLGEIYPGDEAVTGMFGLREDQPGYEKVTDFASLHDVVNENQEGNEE